MKQDTLLRIIEFASGFAVGAFLNMQIIIPFFFRFFRALTLSLRGKLMYRALLSTLLPPVAWSAILFLAYYFYTPVFETDFARSLEFLSGIALAIVILSGYAGLTKQGRIHLKHDFLNRTKQYIATFGASDYLVLAKESFKNGQYERAIKLYKEAGRMNPSEPEVHLGLGLCYINVLSYKEAVNEYDVLYKMNPRMSKILYVALSKKGAAPVL